MRSITTHENGNKSVIDGRVSGRVFQLNKQFPVKLILVNSQSFASEIKGHTHTVLLAHRHSHRMAIEPKYACEKLVWCPGTCCTDTVDTKRFSIFKYLH